VTTLRVGSLAVVECLLAPTVAAAVDSQRAAAAAAAAAVTAAAGAVTGVVASGYFVTACHALFLYPTYVVSLILNSLWCGDIAKTTWALAAGDRKKLERGNTGGGGGVFKDLAAEVYRVLLVGLG
jgi:hypothetical protein